MRVVVAVFGQAAGVASYPILARLAAEKKWEEMKEGLEDALRHVIVTIVPISALMAILSRQIVFLLFSRTRLEVYDIEQTALAMTIFLAGAVAWGVQAILGRGFYALGDTLTPTLIGVDEPMLVCGAIARMSAAWPIQTPAEAARAPSGET